MEQVIQAQRRSLGGFDVGRVLPQAPRRMVGPFVFFDHMGPVRFPPHIPHETDVRPHPHIGLATITYLLEGQITHRDSVGSEQVIRPGEVNWMTAGRGITHSERFEGMRPGGGPMDGLQTWIGLPEADEEVAPGFEHVGAEALPAWSEGGGSSRLIVGTAFGEKSPVRTFSPIFYIHAHLQPGARTALPPGSAHPERAAYVVRGRIEAEGREYGHGDMLVFARGDAGELKALEPSDVMLLGGDPIGPRHLYWNFVSSSRERIEQAKADWRAGRFAMPAHDGQEFIPLPAEPPPAQASPMS